jgi:hypothetical protein
MGARQDEEAGAFEAEGHEEPVIGGLGTGRPAEVHGDDHLQGATAVNAGRAE